MEQPAAPPASAAIFGNWMRGASPYSVMLAAASAHMGLRAAFG